MAPLAHRPDAGSAAFDSIGCAHIRDSLPLQDSSRAPRDKGSGRFKDDGKKKKQKFPATFQRKEEVFFPFVYINGSTDWWLAGFFRCRGARLNDSDAACRAFHSADIVCSIRGHARYTHMT